MNTQLIFATIVALFSAIHLIEYSSYLSRIAGIRNNSATTGYTFQQMAFVATRFFFVLLMPLLGLVVDKKVSNQSYIIMLYSSIFGATLAYLCVTVIRNKIIDIFQIAISAFIKEANLLKAITASIRQAPKHTNKRNHVNKLELKQTFSNRRALRIIQASAIVFGCYSVAAFLAFYVALQFYDLRSTIGQMSGVVNALATLLLTFYIEPKISRSIDQQDPDAETLVKSLMIGRLIGVGILAPTALSPLWLTT